MKIRIPESLLLFLKFIIITVVLVASEQQVVAQTQITFGTYYSGDPVNAIRDYDARGIYLAEGTGTNGIRVNGNPAMVAADKLGNIAVGAMGGGSITRRFGTTLINFSTGTGNHSIAIDNENDFIYSGAANGIRRCIWRSNSENTSVGFYSSSAVGTTVNVKAMNFVSNTDKLFYQGETDAAMRVAITFGYIKGMAFDSQGNLFIADMGAGGAGSISSVSKIFIKKIALVANAVANTTSLTLANTNGIKIGDLVSGLYIPASTYVGSITGNVITLVTGDGVTEAKVTGNITPENTLSITFVTGISKIVGSGGNVYPTPALDATAGNTQLNFTTAVADKTTIGMVFDSKGNLFIADQLNRRLLKVVATGSVVSASSAISEITNAFFSTSIAGMAIDGNDNIFLADKNNKQIFKLKTSDGSAFSFLQGSVPSLDSYTVNGTTVTLTNPNSTVNTANFAKLKAGMYLKGGGIYQGSKVVSVNATSFSFEMSNTANVATAPATITFTPEDGFISTSGSKGYVDGPAGIALINRGSGVFDLAVTEATGTFTRILKNIQTLPDALPDTHVQNPKFHLYLLAGQSNMEGRGDVNDIYERTGNTYATFSDSRILVLNADNEWVSATHPLHYHFNDTGVGPGLDFALKMLENEDSDVIIGLIPSAVGGSNILQWQLGAELFNRAVSKTAIACRDGVLMGVLFHQGEANRSSSYDIWADKLKSLIAGLRGEFRNPELKFIMGELGYFVSDYSNINSLMPEVVATTPYTYLVTAEGLTDKGDKLHFNSKSATELGKRYADALLTALPVQLLNFNVKRSKDGGLLTWSTASEKNNHYFEVERSEDGKIFDIIGKITGAGNSDVFKSYSFIDHNPKATNYYRLRQTDFDGKNITSGILVYRPFDNIHGFSIYPVPVQNELKVNMGGYSGPVIISIYTVTGEKVMSNIYENTEDITIDMLQLLPGMYTIEIKNKVSSQFLYKNKVLKN